MKVRLTVVNQFSIESDLCCRNRQNLTKQTTLPLTIFNETQRRRTMAPKRRDAVNFLQRHNGQA